MCTCRQRPMPAQQGRTSARCVPYAGLLRVGAGQPGPTSHSQKDCNSLSSRYEPGKNVAQKWSKRCRFWTGWTLLARLLAPPPEVGSNPYVASASGHCALFHANLQAVQVSVRLVAGARSARIPAYQKLSRADATGTPATVGPRRVQGEVPRCNRGHRDHLEKPGR